MPSSTPWHSTPRTDANVLSEKQGEQWIGGDGVPRERVLADFARGLERELAVSNTIVGELTVENMKRGWKTPPSESAFHVDAACLEIQRAVSDYMRRTPSHLRDCDVLTGHIVRALRNAAPQPSTATVPTAPLKEGVGPGDAAAAAPSVESASATIPEEFAQLAKFYAVSDMAALVRIQAEHVESLQRKLPPTPPYPGIQRVREG